MTPVSNEIEQALNRLYDVYTAACEKYRKKIAEQADEIEKLRKDLSLSVLSDSEYCKVLERENERLLKSRNRWADKYNKLLVKHRAALEGK